MGLQRSESLLLSEQGSTAVRVTAVGRSESLLRQEFEVVVRTTG